MDSPLVAQLFRRLGTHQFCQDGVRVGRSTAARRQWQIRGVTTRTSAESSWQQRSEHFPQNRAEEFKKYPSVTSNMLRGRRERPRRVKMLMRDFIEDSLYNPHYGYFSKHATILSLGKPFEFDAMADELEFNRQLSQRYTDFEDKLDKIEYKEDRQLWHTPTELFNPYYGEAIARYMVANYKISLFPYHDLLIYEMGAGNGTLMLNILDYIRATDPDVYARTKFRVIEVSSALASAQARNLRASAASRGHIDHVEIINKSIFDWDVYVPSPCFFLALEVFDNFAHDAIRYDPHTDEPLQASVLIDSDGDFYEFYTRALDPLVARYLRARAAASDHRAIPHALRGPRAWRRLRHSLPLAPNLSPPEYLPTRLMQFLAILAQRFPAHRLIASDFHTLPQATPGWGAPVVQTRYRRRTVPVRTPLVHQGYFDILFPTDFAALDDLYRSLTGRLTRVMSHEDFFRRWADVDRTQMRSGENAMLGWYKNASVMVTV